jgi:uncharacterized protein (TIGR01777 family)
MAQNVLLTGGTGFIGKHLTDVLLANGYWVSILSRSSRENTGKVTYYKWNPAQHYIDEAAVLNADHIIHLAGEGIVDKLWTKKRKDAIASSRVEPIELIHTLLLKHNKKLKSFVSASGVGIYGAYTTQKICSEETPAAPDFLGTVCVLWENAAEKIANLQIRTVKIRTGIVLGKNGGFLQKMAPGFKKGFGMILGSGHQYLPWIHIEDLCQIYLKAITDPAMSGAYNAAVTDDTTLGFFAKTLAGVYGYKIWLPRVPAILIRLALGEMSRAVLNGQRVSSEKIQHQQFTFEHTDLKAALSSLI